MKLIFSIIVLIAAAWLITQGALNILLELQLGELFVGYTVLAIGTSLPEIAASLALALKGRHEAVAGTLIGSNIFNGLFVLAIPGLMNRENIMSGHSKWSTIKHKKGIQDARKGVLFTKLSREITVAAKSGDSDPELNFRLRIAIDNAKSQNMPKDNINSAIKRANNKDFEDFIEITYEGKGPHGVLVIIECATDNSTRTTANI